MSNWRFWSSASLLGAWANENDFFFYLCNSCYLWKHVLRLKCYWANFTCLLYSALLFLLPCMLSSSEVYLFCIGRILLLRSLLVDVSLELRVSVKIRQCYAVVTCEIKLLEIISMFYFTCNHVWNYFSRWNYFKIISVTLNMNMLENIREL